MTTPVTNLDTAFTTQGVEHISFWNGRVLTAEDLRDEQLANAASRHRLGRSVGAGIGDGLMVSAVTGQPTRVKVTAGHAIALGGQALELPIDVVVSLVVPASPLTGTGVFVTCEDVPSAVPTGSGLYLLVLRPGSADRDEAAGVPLNGGGVATACGPRYSVDGVSFRLVAVDAAGLAAAGGHDADDVAILSGSGDDDLVRNVQAHLFLDSARRARMLTNPFATPPVPTIDRLRASPGKLEDCEVPLALVAWSPGGVDYVDAWPVRRPPLPRPAAGSVLDGVAGPRRMQAGMAMLLQFQDHLADVGGGPASEHFRYLPPAGLVRTGPGGEAVQIGTRAAAIGQKNFFAGLDAMTGSPLPVARVGPLLHESLTYPPIDLRAAEAGMIVHAVVGPEGAADYVLYLSEHLAAAPRAGSGGGSPAAGVDFAVVKIAPARIPGAPADVLLDATFGVDGTYTFAAEILPGAPVVGSPKIPTLPGKGDPWQIASFEPAKQVSGKQGASQRLEIQVELLTDDQSAATAASLRVNVAAKPATGTPFTDSFTIAGSDLVAGP